MPTAVIAAEPRVKEWVGAAVAVGLAGRWSARVASRGSARRRLDEQQLAALDVVLDTGPLAAGWQDQR